MSKEPIQSYRDLVVWQEAMNVAEACYHLTLQLPKEELYGLSSQIRRSSGSVAANIAEGYGRDSQGSYIHHLKIAQGSLKELETHLLLGARVNLFQQGPVTSLLEHSDSIGRMLRGLKRSLEEVPR